MKYVNGIGKPHGVDCPPRIALLAALWASPMVIDGRVYLGGADGDVVVLNASREKTKLLFQTNLGSSVYSTFVPANGALVVSTRDTLFALANK